ncbi:MAG: prepilin-type N-terminal cleavage/methylation domain-containing protein, partial [Gammaproteobacteria bacterium]
MRRISDQSGVTLVEMIVVIAVTAVVGAMVAVFLRTPIESYVAQDRRARLADAADTALRHIARDVRRALPNSVRVHSAGGVFYLELLATRSGGRYRAEGGGDSLDFSAPDTGFDVLGPAVAVQTGDRIAVYNLGIAGAD